MKYAQEIPNQAVQMAYPTKQIIVQQAAPIIEKQDFFQQAIIWLGHNVPGGFTTIFFSALIGLPICLGFIYKKKIMFWLKPLARYILKRS